MTLQALPLLWPLRYNQVGGHSHHTAFAPALPFSWNTLCSCRSFPLPGMPFAPVDPSLFLECPLLVQIHHSLPYIFQVFDEMSLFRESFPDYPTSNCNPTPSLITLYPPPLFYLFFFPQRIDQLLKYCETYFLKISSSLGFPGGSAVKTPPANAGHVGHIPNR